MTRPAISPRKRLTAAARREARAALKTKTEAALRGAFGDRAQIAIEDGYHDYIRVLIASPLFEGTPEHLRQARIHAALNEGLSAAEHALITMTLGYAPDEPEYAWALRELTERAS